MIATAVNFLCAEENNHNKIFEKYKFERGATHPQTQWENIGGTDVCIYITSVI